MLAGVKYPFETCCEAGGSNNFISSNGVVNLQMVEAKNCDQPSEYISWDGLHPVESFAKRIADGVLTGTHLIPSISIKKALCKS
jgi:phospholipase/lecithinase/hemolysin